MPEHPAPYAVIMAGGGGTRFWPVSRAAAPKQLVRIVGDATMIQATVARLQPLIPAERVLIITTAALAEETRRQLPMLRPEHIIAEPVGRDTAAAVALAALIVERIAPGAPMILLPADQVITPADRFQQALAAGVAVARRGSLVTYGIPPRFAASGYGYIQLGDAQAGEGGCAVAAVRRFVEKPDAVTAAAYLADGGYRWNSGIFTWRSDVVWRELATHCPWLTNALAPLAEHWGTAGFAIRLAEIYAPLKKISIDFALMEKAQNIVAITGDFSWDDVGSWDSLEGHLPADAAQVIARGEVLTVDCRDSLIVNESPALVAGIGLDHLIVVATRDAILVLPKGRSQEVKQVVEALKARGRSDLL
ncbi:mannose-1-phosphate guanylyltransferase [Planctomycetota bacterium]|nr:mannose-1-phosphate guanylyltransferase [Planctomycetota bacterium]